MLAFLTKIQYLLPKRLITKFVGIFARSKLFTTPFSAFIVKLYKPNLTESEAAPKEGWSNFNAFFTRNLRANVRDLKPVDGLCKMPADGVLSQFGHLRSDGKMIQAKGQDFYLDTLLGNKPTEKTESAIALQKITNTFNHGSWAVIYLAPKDYHRVHTPMQGRLTATSNMPGELFSVSAATSNVIPNLYCRNARTISYFTSKDGDFLVIMVGALIVASMVMNWDMRANHPEFGWQFHSTTNTPLVPQCAELGRFELGSTAIVITEKKLQWDNLQVGQKVQLGSALGRYK